MADCKPTEKTINDNLDLSSISTILKLITTAFNLFQKPVQSIPPPLLLIGKELRPGMSPRNLAAARGCCERREKSTSEDAGLRGRRLKGALPVYLSSVMRSLFILVFAGCLLCSRTCGALSYTASGGPLLFTQYAPSAILKPKNRKNKPRHP